MYIDLEKAKQEFLNFVDTYDTNNNMIILKRIHSIRVMEVSVKLSKMMNLNEEDASLATVIGLLHDVARFEQATKFGTFNDLISYDHGKRGVEILDENLRKYVETDKYDEIIKKAVYHHNKFAIEEELSERELFFAKLIRDADKLDIMHEAVTMFWKGEEDEINNSEATPEVLEAFYSKKQVKREPGKTYKKIDKVILEIALIFDINFKESFEIIKEEDYINKILDRFNFKGIDNIRKFANEYVNNFENISNNNY